MARLTERVVASFEQASDPRVRTLLTNLVRHLHTFVGDDNFRDAYGDWSRVSEIAEDGVLLVRPDGHVAWRRATAPETTQSAQDELLGALRRVPAR
ncbi:hypothetical protein [Streptomyces sp. NPDC058457]|uniref:aromatic-ring hydroxylase C-terminal domain-containing protein n=1 Tax=Streptomyces sp. NPDC058457 TaxID=3346507 RepID=UPI0036623456